MRRRAGLWLALPLLALGCGGEREMPGDVSRREAPAAALESAPPAVEPDELDEAPPIAPTLSPPFGTGSLDCGAHADCVVLSGVCTNPAIVNREQLAPARRRVEAMARVTTCGVAPPSIDDFTAACIGGVCELLPGAPEEHACASDDDCTLVEGRCRAVVAISASGRESFARRVERQRRRLGCGYGDAAEASSARCEAGLCVPMPGPGTLTRRRR